MTRRGRRPAKGTHKPVCSSLRKILPGVEEWRADKVEPAQLEEILKLLDLNQSLREAILANMGDRKWKNPRNKAVKERLAVFDAMHNEFCKWAKACGWSARFIRESSEIFMPLLDISERIGYTIYGHQYRSMQYADLILDSDKILKRVVIPEVAKLSDRAKARIRLGMLTHDIGKARIDAHLLRLGGPLSREDKAAIDKHAGFGGEIITAIFSSLASAWRTMRDGEILSTMAVSHHERYDGKGQPKGLIGREIYIGARVATLSDSIDAMTSKRFYRDKKDPPADYKTMIQKVRIDMDTQFNGMVVIGFFELLEHPFIEERVCEIMRSGGGNP